jgi:hypothetical protein
MAEEENENIAIHYIDETVIRVGREVVLVWLWMDGWMDGLQLNLKVKQFWICMHAYFSRKEYTCC